ncbi:hypothetical protein M569_04543, partial [Genlisea aurea]
WIFSVWFTLIVPLISASISLITPSQFLAGNATTLLSPGQEFELGFFSGENPDNWYVGIWYYNIQPRTVVWVANRDSPVKSAASSNFTIIPGGNLALLNDSGIPVWISSSFSGGAEIATVAELLDDGNLIVRYESDAGNYIWQSFDHPTDTLLPGMKLGWDSKTGENRAITSWKDSGDPSTGDYAFRMNTSGFPEVYLTNQGVIMYRSGPWNGLRFSGVPEMAPNSVLTFNFVMTPQEITYSFNLLNKSVYSILVMKSYGSLQRLTWIPSTKIWNLFWYAPTDQCDDYGVCGFNGICDVNSSPVCRCLKGFQPKNLQAWNLRDGSDGCVIVNGFDCETDGFYLMNNVKLPDSAAATVDPESGLDRCREACRKNCSCRGYSAVNVAAGGSGCATWTADLYDMRQFTAAEGGQDFYLRVPAVDLESKTKLTTAKMIGIVSASAVFIALVSFSSFLLWKNKKNRPRRNGLTHPKILSLRERSQDLLLISTMNKRENPVESTDEELDLPIFDYATLLEATDEFSDSNKLGKGGFGSVYKGKLMDGREIAVKRLSKSSIQGDGEFTNEMKMIARLQHRNLVRLLGCCVDMDEKMLVYEYMENNSLDSILFRKDKSSILDWPTRFNIICGVSRGLLYLHQDSRFRIVHRDLKASNILLDADMNPKISDFGMARIFAGDQIEAQTKRVVGTYGYMSPEYAMDGIFSVKSDVFSFGVLVLEIVTGTKNRGFYRANSQLNLLPHVSRN